MKTLKTHLIAAALAGVLAIPAAQAIFAKDAPAGLAAETTNSLTDAQKQDGWRLLFDGKSLDGWHNFKKPGVRPGWQVKDGSLVCVDPKNADA